MTTLNFEEGQVVSFKGYEQPLTQEDLDNEEFTAFEEGEELSIVEIQENEDGTVSYVVASVENPTNQQTAFASELVAIEDEQDEEQEDETEEAPVESCDEDEVTDEFEQEEKPVEAKTKASKKDKPAKAAVPTPSTKKKVTATKEPKAEKPKVEKVKKEKAVVVPQENEFESFADTDAVQQLVEGSPQDVIDAGQSLIDRIEESYFIFGGVLNSIHQKGLHSKIGKDYLNNKQGFTQFLKDVYGIEYRKAMFLIQIYKSFSALGIDEKRLSKIGWSKAKELVNHLATKDDALKLIDFAEKNKIDDLKEHVKTKYKNVKTGKIEGTANLKLRSYSIRLTEDKAELVDEALRHAMDSLDEGEQTPSAALHYICSRYMTECLDNVLDLDQVIKLIEQRYEVKLTASAVPSDEVSEAA